MAQMFLQLGNILSEAQQKTFESLHKRSNMSGNLGGLDQAKINLQ